MISYMFISFSGLTAIVIDRTNTMPDVYGAFFDFACLIKPKVMAHRTAPAVMVNLPLKLGESLCAVSLHYMANFFLYPAS